VWFPGRYYDYVFGGHLAWLVLARDLLLAGLLALLAYPEALPRLSHGSPRAPARAVVTEKGGSPPRRRREGARL
jgi:hypothetical protein